jgi:hypothetical protein
MYVRYLNTASEERGDHQLNLVKHARVHTLNGKFQTLLLAWDERESARAREIQEDREDESKLYLHAYKNDIVNQFLFPLQHLI